MLKIHIYLIMKTTKTNVTQITNKNKPYNAGIDLLRIVAQFYIVFQHALWQGGVLPNIQPGRHAYSILWALQIWAQCAVDIFIIISGYMSVDKEENRIDWIKLILLWLEVVFYNVLGFLLYKLIQGDTFTFKELLDRFFPVYFTAYWFFSVYFAFSLIEPILRAGIQHIDQNHQKTFFFSIFLVFCCYSLFYDGFVLNNGYSVIWFVILFILGATAKKCEFAEHLSILKIVLLALVLEFISWFWKIKGINFHINYTQFTEDSLLRYTSPTITLIALLHVLAFSKLQFSDLFTKIIRFAAPSAFAVYLLNTQPFYWHYVLSNKFISLSDKYISILLPRIFLYTLLFVIAAILIDKIRQLLFKKLKIKEKLTGMIDKDRV